MKTHKLSNLKPIVSISEMSKMLNLSRSRFYQLLDAGILPQPIYCVRTKRPLYTRELQQKCLDVKETNIGANGQYILFYLPRKKETAPRKKVQKNNPIYAEFAETLNSMGLSCSAKEVMEAVEELYSDSVDDLDHGIVIRDLFRKLRSK